MRIRRSRPTKDFVQVPNGTARDDRLSHMARGILVDILSRPAGWETTADEMWRQSVATRGKDSPGRRAFRAAFAELKAHGYMSTSREVLAGGKHSTVLTVSDVPHAGTSVPPAETRKSPGRTDVPHAGTSESGTSERPAQTPITAAHTDVPHGGTSAPPAQTSLFAGRTDVPHAGTSSRKRTSSNTSKTSRIDAPARVLEDGIPDAARPLVDGLTALGVVVRWPFKGNDWFPVLALIASRGVPAMIDCARKITAKYDVEKATYFMNAWSELPPIPPADVARPPLRPVTSLPRQPSADPFAGAEARAHAAMRTGTDHLELPS